MGGKAAEPGEGFRAVFNDASGNAGLDDSGYVLTYGTTRTEVEKATAGTDAVMGVAGVDTVNPLWPGGPGPASQSKFTEYLADPQLWVLTEGTVDVRVTATGNRSTDIDPGDLIALAETTDGTVAQWTDNTAVSLMFHTTAGSHLTYFAEGWEQIVGIAREELDADSNPSDGDSKLLVELRLMGVVS